jgi:glycosyltransferase involved in cell wall biosynthesis
MIMDEMTKSGCKCVIITSDSNHLANKSPSLESSFFVEQVNGMQVCWVRTVKYSAAISLRRILSWLDFEWRLWRLPKKQFPRPDVVIVSSLSIFTILNGLLLRAQYKCRLVFEIRDIWPLTLVEEGGYSRFNPLVLVLAYIEKLGYKHADITVGTMPNLGEHVTEVLGFSKPTFCVPMGVNEEGPGLFRDFSESYCKKYIPQGKFIVAYVGTVGMSNALDTFFECALVMKDDLNIHFVVVGDGDLLSSYKSNFSTLPNVTFAPKVLKSEVPSVLDLCDLLYFSVHVSNVWKFGQSLNKVIDYMLSGKPIVASYTGYPSMINEAQCGSFVAAGDVKALQREVIRYCSMDPEKRRNYGLRGRKWILENRTYKKLAHDYLEILFP